MRSAPVRFRRIDIANQDLARLVYDLCDQLMPPSNWTRGKPPRWRRGDWWLGFCSDRPVAFAGLLPSRRWRQTGYLCVSGVVPDFRGQGLQKRMIKLRINRAKELGWRRVLSDTINDNAASMNSLISCGFRPFTPTVTWGSDHAVYWRRDI